MRIPQETVDLVVKYYLNESNTYICPGKKEYVSKLDENGTKIQVQKRLLLFTVHDLWLNFKLEYQDKFDLPKFSFFAELRPEECIVAGKPGSHVICVCEQHENIKLKLYAWRKDLHYRDLIDVAVCSSNNSKCMLHLCNKCPGVSKIKEIGEKDDDYTAKTLTYKTWIEKGSRAYFESVTQPFDDFKNELFDELWHLTIHQFVSDEQKRFLNHSKENLEKDTCILIMDFSENYSFIIQNSVQGFYYNNSQATIHPFTMYYKIADSDELKNVNFCIISDTTEHYAYTVHAFIEKITEILKKDFPWIKKIIYFSDGAPTQYKNK